MKLSVFQSLWAMENLPWRSASPWTMAERVAKVAEAGFAGVGIDTYSPAKNPPPEVMAPLLDGAGLRRSVTVFVTDDRPLAHGLDYAHGVGAELVVVCGQVFPSGIAEASALVRSWMAQCADAGVEMHLETHRYTLTNDLSFTARLVDAVPEVKLALDLSHYVVGNELPDPDTAGSETRRVQDMLDTLYANGASLQGRIATREQIQVPLNWAPHAQSEKRFDRWWSDAMASWQRRNPDGDCVFLCELGPYPYALVDADGAEFSDRWQEAVDLDGRARRLFAGVQATTRAPEPSAR